MPGLENSLDLRAMGGRRLGAYGIDAPGVVRNFAIIAGALLVVSAGSFALRIPVLPRLALIGAVYCLATVGNLLYTTLAGKFAVWDEILDGLDLRGEETVLDLGCGRGAVLVAAAKRLTSGRAVGVDVWSATDQSGNSPATTLTNAQSEGVADRLRVVTGDATALPFCDGAFDVVVSSMALHNIEDSTRRAVALAEVARVLRPGARLAIVDFMVVGRYPDVLRGQGLEDVRIRPLGWRFWYGGPWLGASLVTGVKGAPRA